MQISPSHKENIAQLQMAVALYALAITDSAASAALEGIRLRVRQAELSHRLPIIDDELQDDDL